MSFEKEDRSLTPGRLINEWSTLMVERIRFHCSVGILAALYGCLIDGGLERNCLVDRQFLPLSSSSPTEAIAAVFARALNLPSKSLSLWSRNMNILIRISTFVTDPVLQADLQGPFVKTSFGELKSFAISCQIRHCSAAKVDNEALEARIRPDR